MTNNVANTLATLIFEYYGAITSAGNECRIHVPGISATLAVRLHEALIAKGLPSFLVIPEGNSDLAPSLEERRLYAEGLTSLREGAMIIVTMPGQASFIQDSIVGSGGAIRDSAYSDEWPWVDDGNESFRFDGKVCSALLGSWGIEDSDMQWFGSLFLDGVLPALSSYPARAEILFEELLFGIRLEIQHGERNIREAMLLHLGIPRIGANPPDNDYAKYMRRVEIAAKGAIEAAKAVSAREIVKSRVENVVAKYGLDQVILAEAVDKFFDRIGAKPALLGLLSLRACFEGDPDLWVLLSVEVIEDLFSIEVQLPKPQAVYKITVNTSEGFVSSDMKRVVTLHDQPLRISVEYAEQDGGNHELVVLSRNNEVCSVEMPEASGISEISVPALGRGGSSTYQICIRSAGMPPGKPIHKIGVERCGPGVWWLVLCPSLKTIKPTPAATEAEPEPVTLDEPTTAWILSDNPGANFELVADDEALDLDAHQEGKHVLGARREIDPLRTASGTCLVEAKSGSDVARVELRAGLEEEGEFTLEDELMAKVAAGQSQSIRKLIGLFEKGQGSFPRLGGLTQGALARIALAGEFESDAPGSHKAIVLNASKSSFAQGRLVEMQSCRCPAELQSRLGAEISIEVKTLLENYSAPRKALRLLLLSLVQVKTREHPDYAAYPLFMKEHEAAVVSLLLRYVEAYQAILAHVASRPSWQDNVALLGLDCVLGLKDNSEFQFALVGPWHPLLLIRRFMVQKNLVEAANHFLSGPNYKYNWLAPLLQETPSFRWLLGPTMAGSMPFYVASTSDPGWLIAIPAVDGEVEISSLQATLRRNLDLDTGFSTADVGRAGNYFKNFLRAFPSKRALTVEVGSSYTCQQVFDSAKDVLRDKKDDSITEIGAQIPGGIHLTFHGGGQEMEEVEWSVPPVCIYRYPDSGSMQATWKRVDIALVTPSDKPKFGRRESAFPVARGDGDACAYFIPMMETTSIGQLPVTFVSTWIEDDKDKAGLEGAFRKALRSIQSLLGGQLALIQQNDLPRKPTGTWTILPGRQVDPAALVSYVTKVTNEAHIPIGLWDYHVSLSRSSDSYFVISSLPPGIAASLEGGPFINGAGCAAQILRELGEVGIAVGREALASETKARGVIGLIGGIRLFKSRLLGSTNPVMPNTSAAASFVIPVDSFEELISGTGNSKDESFRRADLLAIQIYLPPDDENIKLSIVAVECKYRSEGEFPPAEAVKAIEQAKETAKRVRCLAESALVRAAELIAFAQLVNFGLRISSGEGEPFKERDSRVINAIMHRRFKIAQPARDAVLVTNEGGLPASTLLDEPFGYWVRLAPNEWPGLDAVEPSSLTTIRDKLRGLFSGMFQNESPSGDEPLATLRIILPSEQEITTSDPISNTPDPMAGKDSQSPNEPATTDAVAAPIDTGGKALVPESPPVQPTAGVAAAAKPVIAASDKGIYFPVGVGIEPFEGDKQYFFNPSNTTLTHLNVGIVGNLGTGKTQLVKSLIYNLVVTPENNRGRPVKFLVFDYKGDYTTGDFPGRIGARIIEPHHLPISLFDTSCSQGIKPTVERARFFCDVIKKIYPGIGFVQEGSLVTAIKNCYERAGNSGRFPLVHEVLDEYKNVSGVTADSVTSILMHMVDMELFEDDPAKLKTFKEFFDGTVVINLRALGQDDGTKNMIVVVFLNLFYDYMLAISKEPFAGESPHQLRFIDSMLLVDEAEQIMRYDFPVLKNILLQGREFGVGVLLASQFLSHFAQGKMDYIQTMLTWFIHQVPNITNSELQRIGLSDGAVVERIRTLAAHQCLYKTSGINGKFILGNPYYKIIDNRGGET